MMILLRAMFATVQGKLTLSKNCNNPSISKPPKVITKNQNIQQKILQYQSNALQTVREIHASKIVAEDIHIRIQPLS